MASGAIAIGDATAPSAKGPTPVGRLVRAIECLNSALEAAIGAQGSG
jgi:hypothetical protein